MGASVESRICKAVVAMLVMTGVVPVQAQGEPYFGISVGQSRFKRSLDTCSDWGRILDPGYSCGQDDKDSAWKVYGGYEFNRNFAAEVGFANLGEQREAVSGTVSLSPESVDRRRDAWAITGALVGSLAVTNAFGVFGKLGLAYWNAQASLSASGAGGSGTTDGIDLAYGMGLLYGFNRGTAMRVEWERFSGVGEKGSASDIDLISVGVVHRY